MLDLQPKARSKTPRAVLTESNKPGKTSRDQFVEHDEWGVKYKPKSVASMKVHHSKIKIVRQWFQQAISTDRVKPSIMVLFGGSGTGKRSFCELVAQELGITLVEMTASENATFDRYSEPLFGRIFEQERFSKDYTSQLFRTQQSRSSLEEDFTLRVKYSSLPLQSISTLKPATKDPLKRSATSDSTSPQSALSRHTVALLCETEAYTEQLRAEVLLPLLAANVCVLVLMSGMMNREDVYWLTRTQIPIAVSSTYPVETVFWPAVTEKKIVMLLQRICDTERLSVPPTVLQEIALQCNGDVRHAMLQLRFLSIAPRNDFKRNISSGSARLPSSSPLRRFASSSSTGQISRVPRKVDADDLVVDLTGADEEDYDDHLHRKDNHSRDKRGHPTLKPPSKKPRRLDSCEYDAEGLVDSGSEVEGEVEVVSAVIDTDEDDAFFNSRRGLSNGRQKRPGVVSRSSSLIKVPAPSVSRTHSQTSITTKSKAQTKGADVETDDDEEDGRLEVTKGSGLEGGLQLRRDGHCGALHTAGKLLHAKLDERGQMPFDVDALVALSEADADFVLLAIQHNGPGNIMKHLSLAQAASDTNDGDQDLRTLDAISKLFDDVSTGDLWLTKRYDPAALLDRGTSSHSTSSHRSPNHLSPSLSLNPTFHDNNSNSNNGNSYSNNSQYGNSDMLFPEAHVLALGSRCLACSKGSGLLEAIAHAKSTLGLKEDFAGSYGGLGGFRKLRVQQRERRLQIASYQHAWQRTLMQAQEAEDSGHVQRQDGILSDATNHVHDNAKQVFSRQVSLNSSSSLSSADSHGASSSVGQLLGRSSRRQWTLDLLPYQHLLPSPASDTSSAVLSSRQGQALLQQRTGSEDGINQSTVEVGELVEEIYDDF